MDQDIMMWTAWHTAYLHRVDKFPPLSELLKRPDKPGSTAGQSDDMEQHQQMSNALMNALMNMRPKKRRQPPAANTEEPAKAG